MNKAIYDITDFAPYYYNVHILTSVDNGKTFYYAGVGRFCETAAEAEEFIKEYNCITVERREAV